MDHYYVLSRFLICRMLTVTKIPYIKVRWAQTACGAALVDLQHFYQRGHVVDGCAHKEAAISWLVADSTSIPVGPQG